MALSSCLFWDVYSSSFSYLNYLYSSRSSWIEVNPDGLSLLSYFSKQFPILRFCAVETLMKEKTVPYKITLLGTLQHLYNQASLEQLANLHSKPNAMDYEWDLEPPQSLFFCFSLNKETLC